jgi:DNA-binding CsgD family transcriptional regulator
MIKVEKCEALLEIEHVINQYFSKKKPLDHSAYTINNPQLEFIMENFSGLLGMIDLPNNRYFYLGESIKTMFGLAPEKFYEKDTGIMKALDIFKPEHALLFAKEILPKFLEICNLYSATEDVKKLKLTYNTQLKTKEGVYRWFFHQITIVDLNEEGMPLILLKMMHDIDDIKTDEQIQMIISQKQENNTHKTIYEKTMLATAHATDSFATESFSITEREREILQLASYGLSGKKIAGELFISEHTVNTHKKNMLKKLNLSSSNELVRYAMMHGAIV